MSLKNVPAGKALPDDLYVVIEIPANADPIKYEVDKDTGALFVDRFMTAPMFYQPTMVILTTPYRSTAIQWMYWFRPPIP